VILLALLLASLGVADLVRARTSNAGWTAAVAGTAIFALGAAGTGLDWWWYVAGSLATFAWLVASSPFGSAASDPVRSTARRRRVPDRAAYWAIRGLALAVVVLFVATPRLGPPSGWLTRWYAELPYSALQDVSLTTFALGVGGVLFLFETANVIVRAALRGTGSDDQATGAPDASTEIVGPRARWWSRPTSTAPLDATRAPAAQLAPLKGGRFIGPLERVFLLALALSGEFTAIAAVVAAKGIIRFPEISKDDSAGSKAEYFLVGSFASWGLVLAVAVVLRFTALN
jgi:hypothetical protein